MFTRKLAAALGFAIALGAPLASHAEGIWETTNNEAGSRIVDPTFGTTYKSAAPTEVTPLVTGTVSKDGQYVWLSEGSGWQIRPMQYQFENGHFVHVDDPVGHMHRSADNSPLTAQQRATLERSSGS
jgi:hypothetical protein